MNKNIFLIGILILLESCSVSKNKDFYYPKKKVSHTKSDYPISQSLFKSNSLTEDNNNPTTFSKSTTSSLNFSKMSDFEQAVINTWDEFTEEQKQFFLQALIPSEKIDSLFINNK
jgi:hypothetical protein